MSDHERTVWLKLAGLCGVITPIITITLILLSVYYSPWFSWTGNALSDLGVHDVAAIFNSSLIVAGILTLIFALGLLQTLRQNMIGFAGVSLQILAAISLFAIGFFPETAGRIHLYVSASFFVFSILSLFLIGAALVRKSSGKRVGVFSISAGSFEAVVWIAFWALPHKGDAIPEMLTSVITGAWAVIMGIRILMEASKS